jgi:GntR family transcriptional regulator
MAKSGLAGGQVTDFNRSPVARYIQLATLFRNRITSGEWPVGSRIPNVDELAATFSVARGTMREALGLLEDEGLLERLRAKGTFVRKSPPSAQRHKLALDWTSLSDVHEGATIEVLEHRVLKSLPPADRDRGKPAPRYRMMRRLHIRDGRPYLATRFYIADALYRQHAALLRRMPALSTLHRVAPDRLARAWQMLTIGAADIEMAGLLRIPLNAPIARVDRFAIDPDGAIIYVGHGVYRGDAICMEMELR